MFDASVVEGTDGERTTGWFCTVYQQWTGLFTKSNWYDFTLIRIEGEYAPYSDRWEFTFGLLGVNLNVQYVYADRFNRELRAMLAEYDGGET